MSDGVVDLAAVLTSFEEPWMPRTVATVNDYDVRVVKASGEFTAHTHPDTDEFFLVLHGRLTIKMAAGDVELGRDRSTSYRAAYGISPSRPTAPRCCCWSPARP